MFQMSHEGHYVQAQQFQTDITCRYCNVTKICTENISKHKWKHVCMRKYTATYFKTGRQLLPSTSFPNHHTHSSYLAPFMFRNGATTQGSI